MFYSGAYSRAKLSLAWGSLLVTVAPRLELTGSCYADVGVARQDARGGLVAHLLFIRKPSREPGWTDVAHGSKRFKRHKKKKLMKKKGHKNHRKRVERGTTKVPFVSHDLRQTATSQPQETEDRLLPFLLAAVMAENSVPVSSDAPSAAGVAPSSPSERSPSGGQSVPSADDGAARGDRATDSGATTVLAVLDVTQNGVPLITRRLPEASEQLPPPPGYDRHTRFVFNVTTDELNQQTSRFSRQLPEAATSFSLSTFVTPTE